MNTHAWSPGREDRAASARRGRGTASARALLVAAFGLAAPSLAHAADPDTDQGHPGAAVVVTAPKHVVLTSTFTESTVPREELDKASPAPVLTVQTMLNNQPSIFAYTDGPFGVRTNIYFRSFNSGEFSETYDGIGLNDVFNAAITGGAENVNNILLQPQDIDSVQIYRGVNNPAVNSYNSLGGTVDYLPRQPNPAAGAEVGASFGSFNTFQAHGTLNTGDWRGIRQMATLAYGTTDGWAEHTPDWNLNFYHALSFEPGENQALRVYTVINHNQGSPPDNIPLPLIQMHGRDYQWPTSVHNHAIDNTNWLSIVDYQNELRPGVTLDNKVFAGWDSYQRTSFTNPADENAPFPGSGGVGYFLDDGPTFPFWLLGPPYVNGPNYDPGAMFDGGTFGNFGAGEQYHFYGYETWGVGDSPTLTFTLPSNTVIVGANVTGAWLWSREYWWGAKAMPMTKGFNDAWDEWDTRDYVSVYIQDEIALISNQLFLTPGVKYLYAATSDKDNIGFFYPAAGRVSDTESYVSPTVGLSYRPIHDLDVYAAFGQNIKFPDISAFYGAFQTDANNVPFTAPIHIKPEYVNDYELGVRFEHDGFFATVDVYREDFRNTFVSVANLVGGVPNGTSRTTNGGASVYQGVEVQLKESVHWADSDWNGYLNFARNDAKFTSSFTDAATGVTVASGTPVADVPYDLASAGLDWGWNGWGANVDVRYVGKQYTDQYQLGAPGASTIPSYVVVDLGAWKTFDVHDMGRNGSVRVGVNVDNLFNRLYFNEGFTDFDNNGRQFLRPVVGAPLSVTGSVEAKW
jgi:iron complex outermembrane receptor protein